MYINLEKPIEEIGFGDIISFQGQACVIIDSNGFKHDQYPVLIVSLPRGKVLNAFSDLEVLNKESYELIAKESKVEIVFRRSSK